jgi:hypothetical protein
MEITASRANARFPITIFHLKGNLMEEETLHSEVTAAVDSGTRYVLLDLSEVPYISSAGLRAIHLVYQLLQEKGNEDQEAVKRGIVSGTYSSPYLKLLNPSENGLKALSLAGYDMFLEIHKNQQTAVNSF